ncbi:hypothetical protein MC885_008564, partial [Smutsia gigantea]
ISQPRASETRWESLPGESPAVATEPLEPQGSPRAAVPGPDVAPALGGPAYRPRPPAPRRPATSPSQAFAYLSSSSPTGWGGCTESLFSGASLLPPQLQKRLMAWEATHLLPTVLLVLLASGSWEQNPELNKLEGETVSVRCPYKPQQDLNKVKTWCRQTSAHTCTMLAVHPRLKAKLWETRYSIQDDLSSGYFTVTMADLKVKDTGFYWCGIYESPGIFILRTIHLLQPCRLPGARGGPQPGPPPPVHPPNNWNLMVSSAMVAVSLLLALTFLIVLCLWKARGRALKGEDELHHTCDISGHEETTAHRKDTSPARKESQLSWGSDQQMGSGKDTGAICYASLAPLKYFSPEDSIYVNCPNQKPKPEPPLAVEYASIAGSRPQPSKFPRLRMWSVPSLELLGDTQEQPPGLEWGVVAGTEQDALSFIFVPQVSAPSSCLSPPAAWI